MKRLLTISILALLAGTNAAFAADFLIPAPDEIIEDEFNWTGFYIGVNGGYAGNTFTHPFALSGPFGPAGGVVDVITGSGDVTAGGFVGGAQIGANYQIGSIVVGIEGDIQKSTVDGRVTISADTAAPLPPFSIDANAGTSLDWYATIRPRLGFAHDRFLVYVTGGLAYGATTSSYDVTIGATNFADSITNNVMGYTVGAGLEYALTDNVTFKTEYTFTDFQPTNLLTAPVGPGTFSIDSDLSIHAVRAGINFLF